MRRASAKHTHKQGRRPRQMADEEERRLCAYTRKLCCTVQKWSERMRHAPRMLPVRIDCLLWHGAHIASHSILGAKPDLSCLHVVFMLLSSKTCSCFQERERERGIGAYDAITNRWSTLVKPSHRKLCANWKKERERVN